MLSVLSIKYVDEVIIGAPWVVTEKMINLFNIHTVVSGSINRTECLVSDDTYKAPKELGIFKEVESSYNLTVG